MDNTRVDRIREVQETFDRMSLRLNTNMPGIVKSFDANSQTVTVQPAIQMRTFVDGIEGFVDLPEIDNVPIEFPYDPITGLAITWPIRVGASCMIRFSQRCIDNWHIHGPGSTRPPEDSGVGSRHHDMSDCTAFVCAPSLVEALPDWDQDCIALRNRSGSTKIKVKDGEIDIVTGGKINSAGLWSHTGYMKTSGHVEVGSGVSGAFTDITGKTITVQNGIIVGGL